MTVDGAVVPGLLFLLAEFAALAAVGFVVVRAALRETDDRVALAQGLVVGPAIWGVVVNFVMYAIPGMAGAVAGWIFVLALAAVLVWRASKPVRPRLRTAAGFALAAVALFWLALASRQLTIIPDADLHLGMAASIREGGFPPEVPWNPWAPALYHYGSNIFRGLLAPPFGPDLAFAEEVLGAYAWICLVVVVATALLRRASGFAVLAVVPLLLTIGAWTLMFNEQFSILEAPVPTGIPAAGLRAALMDIFWPSVELPYASRLEALPNIWKPAFTLSYALTFVVLARAACAERRSWLSVMTLAALVGFLGLTATSLAPIVLLVWAGLEAIHLIRSRRAGSLQRSDIIRPASGLALAALLLLAGSFSYLVLGGSASSGMSLGGNEYFEGWRLLGTLDRLPGGLGILGLGPLAVAGIAALLARRDRLVLALAVGAGVLLLAMLLLNYEPRPRDIVRIEGHARNFALFALLLALGVRLAGLRPARWRYAVGAAVVALVVWPTITSPVRNLGLAIGNGVELANAQRTRQAPGKRRHVLESIPSDRIADYIRNNTAVEARVFSPHPHQMTYTTGRPNASGLVGLVHLFPTQGPEYRDVPLPLSRAGGRPPARHRIRSRARRVGGGLARRGGRAAQRSPLVRALGPRRIGEPLPRTAGIPQPRRAARARVVRGAAAGCSRVHDSIPAQRIRYPARHPHGVGARSCPVIWDDRPRLDTFADAVAGGAAWRSCARPRGHTVRVRPLDVPSRPARAGLVERRDRRLRA